MVSLGMITMDTTDPRRIATWWAERLSGEIVFDADNWFCIVQAEGIPVALGFQRVDAPAPGKNRLHLDLVRAAGEDRRAVLDDWIRAGATHLGRRGEESLAWDTLVDPDGNEFCIADSH